MPGVFAEREHWQERAIRAEQQVDEIVAQYSQMIAHEREQSAAERARLMELLVTLTSQKPVLAEPSTGTDSFTGESVPFVHPMQRMINEYRARVENEIPEDLVEFMVDQIRMQGGAASVLNQALPVN